MTNKKKMPYIYKDWDRDGKLTKIRRTRGKFVGFCKDTSLINARMAIFKNPKGDILIPEYLLTKETRKRILDQ